MDQVVARRLRTIRKSKVKVTTSNSEKEDGKRLEKDYFIFPILLMLHYPRRREPWNTSRSATHWLKNLFKEMVEIAQSLIISHPKVLACYYDARGLTFEVSKKNHVETRLYINRYLGLYNVLSKYEITVYEYGSKKDTAYSSVHRVSIGNKLAMLTGVFKGRFIRETGITVRHFFADCVPKLEATGEYEELELLGGMVGRCCGKEREIVIDGKTYTADIAAIYFPPSPNNPGSYDNFNEVDINGRIYQSRLWVGDEISISPETVVWMVDQDGGLKTGRIRRLLLYDKELELYNVMQIVSENPGECFSKKGDSGCRIFLPPLGSDHMLHVIGMVISTVRYGTITLTNGVWLGRVLPHFLKTLFAPRCFKGPCPISSDDNLPFGLNLVDGLEFTGSVGKFENLSVQSLKPLYPEDYAIALKKVKLKEFGPIGRYDLCESSNCTPVECSEDNLAVEGINSDSNGLEVSDSGIDTLASSFG